MSPHHFSVEELRQAIKEYSTTDMLKNILDTQDDDLKQSLNELAEQKKRADEADLRLKQTILNSLKQTK